MTEQRLRRESQFAFRQAIGGALGVAGAAKQLAFESVEFVGRRKEAIAIRITHHDARRL